MKRDVFVLQAAPPAGLGLAAGSHVTVLATPPATRPVGSACVLRDGWGRGAKKVGGAPSEGTICLGVPNLLLPLCVCGAPCRLP